MAEIPEHLLERSRAARARLTGEAAPEPAPGEEAAEPPSNEAAPAPEEAAEPTPETAPAPVTPAPVTPEPVAPEPVAPEPVSPVPAPAAAEAAPSEPGEALPVLAAVAGEPVAVIEPLHLADDRPFVDLAFCPDPDSAARRYLVASALWLVVGALGSTIAALQLLVPSFLGGFLPFSYGRLAPVSYNLVLYGWLSLAAMGAMFFVTPRICGVRLYGERLANLVLWVWQLGLVAGVVSVAAGFSTGREGGLEFPLWSAVPLEIGFLGTAICVIGTVSRRRERGIYVSAAYFTAAAIFATSIYAIGNTPGLSGISRAVVTAFFDQNVIGLWVGAAAIGAAYYVVPKVTGNPLYSRNLAMMGFWSLAFLHIWTGQTRLVYGPGQDFLETVAIALGFTLVLPALAVALNFVGTFRRQWGVLLVDPAAKFVMAGSGFLVLGTVAGGLQAVRSMSQVVAFTPFAQGTDTLLLLGAFTMYLLGFAYYALPRISGRQWLSGTASSTHFWLTALGVTIAVFALWGAGLSEGLTWVAGTKGNAATNASDGFQATWNAGRPFLAVALVGMVVFAAAQAVFVVHLLASMVGVRTLRPESHLFTWEEEEEPPVPELAQAEAELEEEQARGPEAELEEEQAQGLEAEAAQRTA